MLFTCLSNCSLLPLVTPPRSLWILAQLTEISLISSLICLVTKQICTIMYVSCHYELYEMCTFSFIPWRALLGHYNSYKLFNFVWMQHLCESSSAYLFTDNFISRTMHMSKRNNKNSAFKNVTVSFQKCGTVVLYHDEHTCCVQCTENFMSFYSCSWQKLFSY